MSHLYHCAAPGRALLSLSGVDRAAFLQGLVSNDMRLVAPERGQWTAFLTPQGKYLHDFFVVCQGDRWLLDAEAARLTDLRDRLQRFRLRSKVTLEPATPPLRVWYLWGEGVADALGLGTRGTARPLGSGVALIDPRDARLGARLILDDSESTAILSGLDAASRPIADWHRVRLSLGVPDGSRDLLVDKTLLLEAGFEPLNGVAFDKGCYMGQELTARTKYRGLVKRHLLPVSFDGPPPPAGTPVVTADGAEAGEIRSGVDDLALAFLRLDALAAGTTLTAGTVPIHPIPPDWYQLRER